MLASVKQTEAASHCLQMSAFTETLLGSVLLCPLLGVSYTTTLFLFPFRLLRLPHSAESLPSTCHTGAAKPENRSVTTPGL